MSDVHEGDEFGRYRIGREIGRGGMGVVFSATDQKMGRRVALKVIVPSLAADPEFRMRFEREARVAATLEHPHVVPVYESGELDGRLFIAMRYIDGEDLASVIVDRGPVAPGRFARLIVQLAGALDAAHRGGLVHRDVKPANSLVSGHGTDEHAYLTDFGLTREAASDSGLTGTGQWVGTVDYCAPEQIQGQRIDARSDVYALGCLSFHALTGRPPYQGASVARVFAHVSQPVPSAREVTPSLPPGVDEVLARAMSKAPDDRYQSAGDFGRALSGVLTGVQNLEPERSVATGRARSGIPTVEPPAGSTVPAGATPVSGPGTEPVVPAAPVTPVPELVAHAALPTAPDPATQRVPSPPRRPPPDPTYARPRPVAPAAPPRKRGPAAAIAAVIVLLLAGAGIAALALGGGDDGSTPASSRAGASSTGDGGATATTAARQPRKRARTQTSAPVGGGSAVRRTPARAVRFFNYTGPAFQARLPSGRGWSAPAQSEPTPGRLFRTSVRGPDGLFVIVDYTPQEPAVFGGSYRSRTQVGQTAFGEATRYVFQGGRLPECQRSPCVDYIINDTSTGEGFGVLGGGGNPAAAARIARTVAESVTPLQ